MEKRVLLHGLHFGNIRGDVYGGLTAAVVALPLALAFGVASGACTERSSSVFFAAVFGGTPSQISGPTGPMTVVTAPVITQLAHEPALAFTVVMLGGLLQILFGILRLGRYINLVPYPVISGFMTGIGCIIFVIQLPPLVGHPNSVDGTLGTLVALPGILADPVFDAAVLAFVALAVVFLLAGRVAKFLPPALARIFHQGGLRLARRWLIGRILCPV